MASEEEKEIREILDKLLNFKNLRDLDLEELIYLVSYDECNPTHGSVFLKVLREERERRKGRSSGL